MSDLDGVPVLPVEEVARYFMEHEVGTPFGAIKSGRFEQFEYEQTLTRLTELLLRARLDGARTEREACAQVADEYRDRAWKAQPSAQEAAVAAEKIANVIRSRT